jgi:hypothetical protein
MNYIIETHNNMYYHHVPKSNCEYCKRYPRNGRRIIKGESFGIAEGQGNFSFTTDNRTTCGYHSVILWLQQHPEIKLVNMNK